MEQSDYSAHAAQTVYAHYHAAMDGRTMWSLQRRNAPYREVSERELTFSTLAERLRTPGNLVAISASSSVRQLILSSIEIDWERQKGQTYSPDIRSLELTFSAMMLREVE
jgi:hypothetical protein